MKIARGTGVPVVFSADPVLSRDAHATFTTVNGLAPGVQAHCEAVPELAVNESRQTLTLTPGMPPFPVVPAACTRFDHSPRSQDARSASLQKLLLQSTDDVGQTTVVSNKKGLFVVLFAIAGEPIMRSPNSRA